MQTCWIITVDGKPTDIRDTAEMATRQAKVRRSESPQASIQLHYGDYSARTYHDGTRLVVDITAPDLGDSTLFANIAI